MITRYNARIKQLSASSRALRTLTSSRGMETDACGIPLKPTWSIRKLLSSYPSPSISPATFKRLHELSALVPPVEGTSQYELTKKELEELVRLVEAVKFTRAESSAIDSIPDGRIWEEGSGMLLTKVLDVNNVEVHGRELLKHASQTINGMYIVETDRKR
ncbi:hypothetical protein PAXRUDRAFT_821842 [Paxillus rubicundulus Ve08.2h10]|uniref:Glutamyl-tRNA(Gln) amidotransferase subunit F, mitochondrial n=1 Tax=Paxillus rubicundulus Ve08.2h10 TaxID=930991 RepID=A0A0D0E604_9AGAM|nr:hypothetical protein PAXRUDRAFT_821842 [Paxillus rubicundulus Ve08.2h10]